ncbi:hypothetical protein [Ancylobacter oerskovii]|uniref:Uncharacterized protein n=1 Tax=Ancylobacter oerskovii TaxID=459519 RepID=A0ABW4YR16_9HYPH|nr:hypothetical protein [Ancylobacter oerskovii]MBS7545724.1 hypothetical protein [Ancylobacter oerskovii]
MMLAEIGAILHQPFSEMERRRWSDFQAFHDEARRIAGGVVAFESEPDALPLPEPPPVANPDGLKFGDIDPVSGLKIGRVVTVDT